jgi:hypothetical protein
MRIRLLQRGGIVLFILFVGSYLPLIGCNDDSKTSGTQVEVSDKVQARRDARAESYKGGPPKKQAKGAVQ